MAAFGRFWPLVENLTSSLSYELAASGRRPRWTSRDQESPCSTCVPQVPLLGSVHVPKVFRNYPATDRFSATKRNIMEQNGTQNLRRENSPT